MRAQDGRYDVVVTDMGRGSDPIAGLTLLRAMHDENIQVPTIVYSNGVEAERRRREIEEAGAVGPIVGPERLIRELASVVERHGA